MQSPSLELIDDHHIYISGEVIVHPSAAIAPGVLLQADPGCRLTIAAGVCIGRGSVLHAHQGTLAIGVGAILGSGVLIVGQGTIGENACIGSLTTIINGSVESSQSIPAQSLFGDTSRQVVLKATDSSPSPPSSSDSSTPPPTGSPSTEPQSQAPGSAPTAPSSSPASPADQPNDANNSDDKAMRQVYGQAYVERIMITMFPHRRSLDTSNLENPDTSGTSNPANQTETQSPKPPE